MAKGFEALGYRQAIDFLDGTLSLPEAISLTQRDTRRYAKRQWTWFRSLSECRSVPVAEPVDVEADADAIGQAGAEVQ